MPDLYVVITGRAEGNERSGFRVVHYWDGRSFATKPEAVTHGFKTEDCDDFGIGVIINGQLASLWWMDEQKDVDAATLARISAECGFARLGGTP